MEFDAIILAGGRSSRLGGVPKSGLVYDGATLLERSLRAAGAAGRTVVVGPDPGGLPGGVLTCREEPPFAGPAAAIAAGLAALAADHASRHAAAAPYTLVLACDMPGRPARSVPWPRRWPRPVQARRKGTRPTASWPSRPTAGNSRSRAFMARPCYNVLSRTPRPGTGWKTRRCSPFLLGWTCGKFAFPRVPRMTSTPGMTRSHWGYPAGFPTAVRAPARLCTAELDHGGKR